jgi:diguanylate cyclase (GGDEF)-like protein/PAS domain S-box-containing protein
LTLLTQTILPALHILTLPNIGQLYAVIMILGIYIVISKYKFLKMPEDFIFEEVMREMLDMTILLNAAGHIVKVNKNTLLMLNYQNEELLGQPVKSIIPGIDLTCLTSKVTENIRFSNVALRTKSGTDIPVNVSCTPILDRNINDLLGSILVIQDLRLINELKQKNDALLERAIRDSLTRLYNHQYSIELLEKELTEALAGEKYLSLIMLDIDDFKQVNDTCGHQFGDSILVTIANLLVDIIQNTGYVGRYGGEEFIIILPETPIDRACRIGEEIRSKIKNHAFPNHFAITISMGIRELHNEDASKLIKKADQLLYTAKAKGKDRVEAISTSF